MNPFIQSEYQYGAQNYDPIPIVIVKGQGIYLWDDEGNKYIDMMSAYSAVSHGHCHPRLVKALTTQAQQLAVVSRAFYSNKLAALLKKICELTKLDKALPMNTGAEAVETALKAARKWAYTVKGVAPEQAEIISCVGNFHGRTITIVGMSSESQYRAGFGPFPSGFKQIPYGDLAELEKAITPNTAAFIVEPIQGEGGIIVPPAGYLKECARICNKHNVLLILDEIQTGLGRTGKFLACEHDDVTPDAIVLGKALGGGLLPISFFITRKEVMDVFTPGDHGSTFGGNPLAATVCLEALNVLIEDNLISNAAKLGDYFIGRLRELDSPLITEVRGQGLLVGLVINPRYYAARTLCLKLAKKGVLTKETHGTVIRLAPPLIISKEQLDTVITIISDVLTEAKATINGELDQI